MSNARTPLAPVILSLLIGGGQALAAILALLPLLVSDADIPRFLVRAMIPALVLQVLGLGLGALLGLGRCPWVRVLRLTVLGLSVAVFWCYGWGPGVPLWLAAALVLAFILSACSGALAETVLGVTFATTCFGIGHPLMLVDLVPVALALTWALALIRLVLWLALGLTGHTKDIAIVAFVLGTLAPTIMLLGGWLGHDTALISSAFITQFMGFVAARWVARAASSGRYGD